MATALVGQAAAGPLTVQSDKTNDMDLWRDGLRTLREQLADAEASMIWSRPLSRGGVLPDHVYDRGPPRPQPDPPEPLGDDLDPDHWQPMDEEMEGPRALHISLWIATPYSEPETVNVGLAFPLTVDTLFDVARDSTNAIAARWLTFVVATKPQIHADYASLLLLPDWLPASDRTAVLLDARSVDRGIHAFYVHGVITRYIALQQIDFGNDEPYDVFVGGDLAPLGRQESRDAEHGLVVQVLPRGRAAEWEGRLEDRLQDPHPETTQIVVVDLRGIGHWPQWLAVHDHLFHAGSYVESLQVEVIADFTVVVRGGLRHGNEGYVWVEDGDRLEIHFQRIADLTPSEDSSGNDPSDGSSSAGHPLPGSSDFTDGEPPHGPGPWGPPPPSPVNGPRSTSRSPRRHHNERGLMQEEGSAQPLCLAELVPVPVYDIAQESIALPRIPMHWKDRPVPWPLTWVVNNLDDVPLKSATLDALAQTIEWTELLARPRGDDVLELHLYTDGSANNKAKTSGYAVAVLLKLGVYIAVFGIISEQLLGNAGTPWPVDAPAALRAEQVAITVALMWLLQFQSMLSSVKCEIHFDCLAAGYAATGQWQAPDNFGERAHLLESYIGARPGIDLHMAHVKAHANDPWNELSDCLAKEAAAGRCRYGAPPPSMCAEFLELNLAWLVSEVQAANHNALPIRHGHLEWHDYKDDGFRLQPHQLIPVRGA